MTSISIFKAFHIIGAIAWFAGLFYLVRLFVYHAEADSKAEPEKSILQKQFNLMGWRVYKIILNPAMMITWTCGIIMLILYGGEWLKTNPWMHLKLTLLVLLTGYQLYCKGILKKLEKGTNTLSPTRLRMVNEVTTLFLVAIVLLAVLRNYADFGMVMGVTLVLGAIFYFIIKAMSKKSVS